MNTLLIVCMVLGIVSKFFIDNPQQLISSINWWLIRIAMPALILVLIPQLHINSSFWFPAASIWLAFLISFVVFGSLGKIFAWDKNKTGVLIMLSSIANTSFMGFPIIDTLYGDAGMKVAVIADQLGSFMVISTVGFALAVYYTGKKLSISMLSLRIIKFPPFVALVVALSIWFVGFDLPLSLNSALERIGQTMSPLAVFTIGLQLKLKIEKIDIGYVGCAVLWKLACIPLFIFVCAKLFAIDTLTAQVSVMENAMPTMITATIVASSLGLNIKLANSIQGWTILFSFLSIPIWQYVLAGF